MHYDFSRLFDTLESLRIQGYTLSEASDLVWFHSEEDYECPEYHDPL